jgi:hypothetical protein
LTGSQTSISDIFDPAMMILTGVMEGRGKSAGSFSRRPAFRTRIVPTLHVKRGTTS